MPIQTLHLKSKFFTGNQFDIHEREHNEIKVDQIKIGNQKFEKLFGNISFILLMFLWFVQSVIKNINVIVLSRPIFENNIG